MNSLHKFRKENFEKDDGITLYLVSDLEFDVDITQLWSSFSMINVIKPSTLEMLGLSEITNASQNQKEIPIITI